MDVDKPGTGIVSNLLSVVFPWRCVHCGREGKRLCPPCAADLEPVGTRLCRRCGKPAFYEVPECRECRGRRFQFGRARAAFRYEGPARSLVHCLKFSGQRRLAALMADLSCGSSGHLTDLCKGANLTYVPLHESRLAGRGYNQAGLYAGALSRKLGLPLRNVLLKKHSTPSQNELGFNDRMGNVFGSFGLRRRTRVNGGRMVLVDDVYTTGSTVSECARVLREGLGVKVDVWTFARTVKS